MDNDFIEVLNVLNALKTEIKELRNSIRAAMDLSSASYESKETKDLNLAVSKAFSEYVPVISNRVNAYYRTPYADLEVIMGMVRPILAKHGLSVTQRTILDVSGTIILQTRLWHSSGQWVESRNRVIPSKNDYHTYGSAMAYMKRDQVMSLLNITIADDMVDDDAEMQQSSAREIFSKGTALNQNLDKRAASVETITKEQLEELEYEIGDYSDLAEEIMDKLRLRSLAEMPKSDYFNSIKRIREITNARKNR